jgi:hypothetical protein
MKLISRSYIRSYRIFCLLFALHFLNVSIDSKDRHPDFVPEDLSLNDIESIAEFLTEVVFGWDDAFHEHDEDDSDGHETIDFYKFYVSKTAETIAANMIGNDTDPFVLKNSGDALGPQNDIHSPPPRG